MHTAPDVPGYRLTEVIGRGSTSTVWAATDGAERDLAVKVVPVAVGDNGDAIAFELSALAATRGRHEHLVTVHDVVSIADPVPAVVIVMDRLRHGTLARLVTTRGHLLPGEVVTVLTPVAMTVAHLHDAAVVHGDLSAANIGLDRRGRPVVLDLGVSAVIGTPREEVYGTPGFVAPEVVAGGLPTPSSDVYAMGALGWYALTGEPPAIPVDRPELTDLAPGVPAEMTAALELALHPDPESRSNARELATAIYESTPALPITPGSGGSPETMLTHRVRELARSAAAEEPPSRRHRRELRTRSRAAHWRILTAVVAAVVLGGAGAAIAATGQGNGRAPHPEAPESRTVTKLAAQPTAAEILTTLVDARARAWGTGDAAGLDEVFAADSPALERDAVRVRGAAEAGHRYEGLAFDVAQVRALEESVDRLRLEATVTTSPYAVRTDSPAVTSVEQRSARTDRLEVVLTRVDGAWRISEIAPSTTAPPLAGADARS